MIDLNEWNDLSACNVVTCKERNVCAILAPCRNYFLRVDLRNIILNFLLYRINIKLLILFTLDPRSHTRSYTNRHLEAQGVPFSNRSQRRAVQHISAVQRTLSRSCRDFVTGKRTLPLRERANDGRHCDRSHRLCRSTRDHVARRESPRDLRRPRGQKFGVKYFSEI